VREAEHFKKGWSPISADRRGIAATAETQRSLFALLDALDRALGRLKAKAAMTHVQYAIVIHGAVCVGATLGYVRDGQSAIAHKH